MAARFFRQFSLFERLLHSDWRAEPTTFQIKPLALRTSNIPTCIEHAEARSSLIETIEQRYIKRILGHMFCRAIK